MNKGQTEYTNWQIINWRKLEKSCWKLQKRIFRAKFEGNVKLVKQLQKLLVKSFAAKCVAVSTDEKRPLSIPTIHDRALQTLVKMAIEPEWEAVFEPNSYGFRSGRSCHDAIEQIYSSINKKPKWVLDADISKCFDKINHKYLLENMKESPRSIKKQIKAWLKAGYMDDKGLFPTEEGTPQGGTISPLLANIALHGMETVLNEWVKTWKGQRSKNLKSFSFIRYADDFVCLHKSKEVIEKAKEILSDFLKPIGLELKPEKTQIVHTLETKTGFDFLGFNVRQYDIENGKTSKHTGIKREYKTLIKPSKKSIKKHYEKIAETVRNNRSAKQENLIKLLNPIIRGWSNYFSTAVSKEVFSKIDSLTYGRLRRWCIRRHPMKSKTWINRKYYHQIVTKDSVRNWVFKEGDQTLLKHADTKIERHTKVRGDKSPFDGDTIYWASRLGKSKELGTTVTKLLKQQKGKCKYCDRIFSEDSVMEKDHIIPTVLGGKNSYSNLQLLHAHCHDQKTAKDGSLNRSTHDKSQVGEKRNEVKVSRSVLKTSSSREGTT